MSLRKFNLSLDDMSPYKLAGLNFESIDDEYALFLHGRPRTG